MWKSALSNFQGLWEGWEKQLHRFSQAFHGPAFPRLLRSSAHSGGSFRQSVLPFSFEFNRAGIAQRRVHASLVIPEQPGDGFILGLTNRFKALTVQSFHLQRAEQCLRAGVVPAVALAAHRLRDCMLF